MVMKTTHNSFDKIVDSDYVTSKNCDAIVAVVTDRRLKRNNRQVLGRKRSTRKKTDRFFLNFKRSELSVLSLSNEFNSYHN